MTGAALQHYVDSRPALREAIAIVRQANLDDVRTAASDADEAALYGAIIQFLRTGGGSMSPENRADFAIAAKEHLIELPFHLVMDALRLAPRKVRFSSELVPWVFASIEKAWEGRKKRYLSMEAVVEKLEARD